MHTRSNRVFLISGQADLEWKPDQLNVLAIPGLNQGRTKINARTALRVCNEGMYVYVILTWALRSN